METAGLGADQSVRKLKPTEADDVFTNFAYRHCARVARDFRSFQLERFHVANDVDPGI